MDTKRLLLFLVGCMGARFFLTYLATNKDNLKIISYLTLLIGIGFMYVYFIRSETADRQLEWTGEKMIWWDNLRPVHGFMYLLFTFMAYNKNEYSWIVLLIDTFVGLVAWLNHHKFF